MMQRVWLQPLRRACPVVAARSSPRFGHAGGASCVAARSTPVVDHAAGLSTATTPTKPRPFSTPQWATPFPLLQVQVLPVPPAPLQQQAMSSTAAGLAHSERMQAVELAMGPLASGPLGPAPQPVVVVISGPSGVGKDAVIKRLKEARPDLYFVVTATSRAMRPGEVEGVDYFFVAKARFEEWLRAGQLLESAVVYGEYKGIPRQQVDQALAKGTDVVLRIDVQGAATVRRLMPGVVSIFITADSERLLVQRLVARNTEPLDKMLVRVQTARQEATHIPDFDYVVVNRDGELDACVAQIGSIIDAERCRVHRKPLV